MIEDRDRLGGSPERQLALECLEAGIESARPDAVVHQSVQLEEDALVIEGTRYPLAEYAEIVVVGGGKAAAGVAAALEDVLGDRLARGAVVTNDPRPTDRVEVHEGDHPVPSTRGVEGAQRVLSFASDADAETLVLAVITGGASALLPAPAEGISLADLQAVTNALLESGATIHEINAVRKHLSAIKGGRLAQTASPATVVGLIFSDVVGNDLDVIASGPTAPDASTYAEAKSVLDRFGIDPPESIRDRLERGVAGDIDETPRAGDPVFDQVTNHVLADGFTALTAAEEVAREDGSKCTILSSRVRGEAREAAKTQVAIAEEVLATGNPLNPPAVVLTGGETTVTVRGDGTGGPNQEFALSAAIELDADHVVVAAVDTDGSDGATDAAGALVDAATVTDVDQARDALDDNDAYPYLSGRDALITTGPTGTNVNDLRVVVIGD